tara:strand:+ start:1098 stop:1736 length:639 start_codon:yes stop_codon:yes gene_type:complete
MPYYREKNILFVHIPKTAGSNIEKQLEKITKGELKIKGKPTIYSSKRHKLLDYPYNLVSPQHQFYSTLYLYRNKLNINFDGLKIFSVVRNPYDRIISDLYWCKLITKSSTSKEVYKVIKNNYLNRIDLDNHNVPQYKFLTDKNDKLIQDIKIFKCESLNSKNAELNEFLNLKININKKDVNKDYSKYLNRESIDMINTFYEKDFKLFDYELL